MSNPNIRSLVDRAAVTVKRARCARSFAILPTKIRPACRLERRTSMIASAAALVFAAATAVSPAFAHAPEKEMATAANAIVATLSAEQRAKAVIPFTEPERMNWHYVPRARQGLSIKRSEERR